MKNTIKVRKWGQFSLGVVIPINMVRLLDLKENDLIEVDINKIPKVIIIKCPCGELLQTFKDKDVADCPSCMLEILNKDFVEVEAQDFVRQE